MEGGREEVRRDGESGGLPGGVAAGAGRGSEQEEMERETVRWSGAAV